MRKIPLFIAVALIVALSPSCVKDEIDLNDPASGISPVFGVPLLKADISAQRVMDRYDPSGEVITEEEQVLSLVYNDTLTRLKAHDFLVVPDQHLSQNTALTPAQTDSLADVGETTLSGTVVLPLEIGDDRLDSVRLASGSLTATLTADGDMPVSGHFTLLNPSSTEEFVGFSLTDGQGPTYLDTIINLDGRLLNLEHGDQPNGLTLHYALTFSNNGGNTPENISFGFDMEDLVISAAGGYIAPRSIALDRFDAHIGMFDSDYSGTLRLEDPKVNLFFQNGFGLSVRPVADQLEGVDNSDNTLVVEGENIAAFPVVAGAPEPGLGTETVLTIDNETMTPSVTDFMAFAPNRVYADLHLDVNPNDDPAFFVDSSSALDVRFEVEIPIFGSLADFRMADTTEVDLADALEAADDFEDIERIDFRFFVENSLPMEAALQVVFLDSTLSAVDSLFTGTQTVVPSPPVDLSAPEDSPDYGRVTGTSSTVLDIPIPRDRVQKLDRVTHIAVRVTGHTTGNGSHPVRVYPEDHIAVSLAAKAKFNIH